ncbi:MAG TPA: SPOR domain-containing protein [Fibrobacteria bacterium]|nr:SPOR domain-containing protein [Fibrobacteria bacterium]
MRTRMSAGLAAISAGALVLCGCKKEVKPSGPVAQIPAPTGDTNFTPPEILRSAPSGDTAKADSVPSAAAAAPAMPHPKPDSTPVAHPAAPAVAPKPAPTAPTPATTPAKPPKAPAPVPKVPVADQTQGNPGAEGDWVLQVSIHKTKADADAHIAKFAAEGIPAYAIPVPTDGAGLAGQYWRVRVGRFTSRAAAQAFADKRLAPEGLKPWIDRKSNESRSDGTP